MVTWPAVLKFEGDPELLYVASQSDWNTDKYAHAIIHGEGDILIDSEGSVFSLVGLNDGVLSFQASEIILDLSEMIDLIKAHQANLGSCCIAKISFRSFAEAVQSVDSKQKT